MKRPSNRRVSEDPANDWFSFPDLEPIAAFPNLGFIASFPDFDVLEMPTIDTLVDELLSEYAALDFGSEILAGIDDRIPVFDFNYDLDILVW